MIQQVSETVFPMYKAFIEPDLNTAEIKVTNNFNPFAGFKEPIQILKTDDSCSVDMAYDVLKELYPGDEISRVLVSMMALLASQSVVAARQSAVFARRLHHAGE